MRDYCPEEWQIILQHNGLDSFDALWQVQAEWFEPPNQRRGGWSGVVRIELQLLDGGSVGIFLKRQENHTRRTLRHPFSGESTINGEIKNILALQQAQVPTLEPVFYGERKVDGKRRAILVTRELDGFCSLDQLMEQWLDQGWGQSVHTRKLLIKVLACDVRRMHEHHLVHNALHPKHVFVRLVEGGDPEVCLIDLEKMRYTLTARQAGNRDLDSLNRRTRVWTRGARLTFLKYYTDSQITDHRLRSMWSYLVKRKIRFIQKGSVNDG